MKHIFFDLDHTLWDFEKNSEVALGILYEELKLGNELRSFQSFHTTYRKINGELWKQYSKGQLQKSELRIRRFHNTLLKFGVNNPILAEQLAKGYVERSPYQTNLFPNTKTTLLELQKKGHVMHIITNGFKEIQEIKLQNSGIRDFFDTVVCSEDVGKHKPAKEVFSAALLKAKTNSKESLMVGDNYIADVLGAERSGICGVLFDPKKQHKQGTHEWHINDLKQVPELLPWIAKSRM